MPTARRPRTLARHVRHTTASALLLGAISQLQAELVDPQFTLSAPETLRVVTGSPLDVNFQLQNSAPEAAGFTAQASGGSFVNYTPPAGPALTPPADNGGTWSGLSLAPAGQASLRVGADLGGISAGQSQIVSLSASNPAWNATPSASTTVQVVQNRQITGSVTIDAGRHMWGQQIGSLALSGGSHTDAEATRVTIHGGGHAQFANGLRLSSATTQTFNGADQTHNLDVTYNGHAGSYSISQTLPGIQPPPGINVTGYKDASGAARNDFGGRWDVEARYGSITGETQVFSSSNQLNGYYDKRILLVESVTTLPSLGGYKNPAGEWEIRYQLSHTLATEAQFTPSESIQVGGREWNLSRGGDSSVLKNERVGVLISAEDLAGANLDLSGVEVNISGQALHNRRIYDGQVHLGRFMVGSPSQSEVRTDTVNLFTGGSDDQYTRLQLAAFDRSENGVHAVSSGGEFNSAGSTASVTLTGTVNRDTSTRGAYIVGVNVGSAISTSENNGQGLAGQTVQDHLFVGYKWNAVENNQLTSSDFLVITKAGALNTWARNESVQRTLDESEGTRIGYNADVWINGSYAPGVHNLGTTILNAANGRVTGEGLVGETVIANTSFNTRLVAIAAPNFTLAASKPKDVALTGGDTITLENKGTGLYAAGVEMTNLSISGRSATDYTISLSGGPSIPAASSSTITINYGGDTSAPVEGGFSRVARATLNIDLEGRANLAGILAAHGADRYHTGDVIFELPSRSFALENRFDAPASANASATVAARSDFARVGLALTNTAANTSSTFAAATSFELRGGTVAADTAIAVEFKSVTATENAAFIAAANSTFTQTAFNLRDRPMSFTSDVVNLTGLNGIQHVIELTFDAAALAAAGGTPALIWLTNVGGQDAWVHSVLGNSDVSNLNLSNGTLRFKNATWSISNFLESKRFAGTFDAYSMENATAELGAWGYDRITGKAWAVIDHNSSFAVAAVPEPSAFAVLAGFGALGLAATRRRRRA